MRTILAILGIVLIVAGLYVGYLVAFVGTPGTILFCGFWVLIILGFALLSVALQQTPEERAQSALDEFKDWCDSAVRKGYIHRPTAALTMSPYTRPRLTHHYAVGSRGASHMGDQRDTVEDTLVSTWGKSFFLTEANETWEDDIQIIKFENLMIVRNSLNDEFKVFASRDV